jgi:hypothetical protein
MVFILKLLFITLPMFTFPEISLASNCPEGHETTVTKIYFPKTSSFMMFYCRKEGRREFWTRTEAGKIIEATVSLFADDSFQFNLYREVSESGNSIKTMKYDNSGELVREEHFFTNGDLKIRITAEPPRMEEYAEDNHNLKIKECWKEKREATDSYAVINKTLFGQYSAIEEYIYAPEGYTGSFKVMDRENKVVAQFEELRNFFTFATFEICTLLDTQKFVSGELVLKKKEYDFPSPAIVPLSSIKKLITEPDSTSEVIQNLNVYLKD